MDKKSKGKSEFSEITPKNKSTKNESTSKKNKSNSKKPQERSKSSEKKNNKKKTIVIEPKNDVIFESGRKKRPSKQMYKGKEIDYTPYISKPVDQCVKVIPLGGLNEIGKNMTAFEYGNEIVIVDVGMAFAESDMPGVDCVIQDYTYIKEHADRLVGIVLTHGHEDHIGALPYLLKEVKCPIYSGKLTIELVRHKLSENGVSLAGISLQACKNGDVIKLGKNFKIEFIRVNHSIADSYALAIKTPAGVIIHSGDFKIDYTPINGRVMDLQRFAEYGKEGVLLFMCESTNIEIDGFSPSEKSVGESFQRIFQNVQGRIIIATFSSHVHRMQQIFTAAEKYGRHVCLSGRSMITCFQVANSLGYIDMNPDTLINIEDIDKYPNDKVVILTTGSQAEPMSALSRMAFASHKSVEIHEGDTVIISAHPIPGNEKPIYKVINELFKRGAHVIYESLADVHVSGHAYRNELAMLHSLLKPKYFVPVHGEYRMLYKHKMLATSLGMPAENVFIMSNGDILSLAENYAEITDHIPANPVLIDGSGVGDIQNHVLADRRLLAQDGCVSVGIVIDDKTGELACLPIVNSVGFVFDDEALQIHHDCAAKITGLLASAKRRNNDIETEVSTSHFNNAIRNMLFDRTKRRPLIICNVSHINQKYY